MGILTFLVRISVGEADNHRILDFLYWFSAKNQVQHCSTSAVICVTRKSSEKWEFQRFLSEFLLEKRITTEFWMILYWFSIRNFNAAANSAAVCVTWQSSKEWRISTFLVRIPVWQADSFRILEIYTENQLGISTLPQIPPPSALLESLRRNGDIGTFGTIPRNYGKLVKTQWEESSSHHRWSKVGWSI